MKLTKLMKNLTPERVSANIEHFRKARTPDHRFASFDYCFNYFHNLKKEQGIACIDSPERVEQSCMQLAFFLASWGMLRGGTILLWKSAYFCRRALGVIVACDPKVWEIDLPYSDDGKDIRLLLEVGEKLREALWTEDEARTWFSARLRGGEKLSEGKALQASNTLVTKIMLGVFANVPAFDTNVRAVFGDFNKNNLQRLTDFYKQEEIQAKIDRRIPTLDFSGNDTDLLYTKAKIMDMVGFEEGLAWADKKKKRRLNSNPWIVE